MSQPKSSPVTKPGSDKPITKSNSTQQQAQNSNLPFRPRASVPITSPSAPKQKQEMPEQKRVLTPNITTLAKTQAKTKLSPKNEAVLAFQTKPATPVAAAAKATPTPAAGMFTPNTKSPKNKTPTIKRIQFSPLDMYAAPDIPGLHIPVHFLLKPKPSILRQRSQTFPSMDQGVLVPVKSVKAAEKARDKALVIGKEVEEGVVDEGMEERIMRALEGKVTTDDERRAREKKCAEVRRKMMEEKKVVEEGGRGMPGGWC